MGRSPPSLVSDRGSCNVISSVQADTHREALPSLRHNTAYLQRDGLRNFPHPQYPEISLGAAFLSEAPWEVCHEEICHTEGHKEGREADRKDGHAEGIVKLWGGVLRGHCKVETLVEACKIAENSARVGGDGWHCRALS